MKEELIWEVERMFHERFMYFVKKSNTPGASEDTIIDAHARARAYKSACDMLVAAVLGNEEILKEFDYYGE